MKRLITFHRCPPPQHDLYWQAVRAAHEHFTTNIMSLIKANKYKGFVNICMFEEPESDYLFYKGVDGMKYTPTIYEFNSWEELEHWLPESIYGKSLSEKAQESYDKWEMDALNSIIHN